VASHHNKHSDNKKLDDELQAQYVNVANGAMAICEKYDVMAEYDGHEIALEVLKIAQRHLLGEPEADMEEAIEENYPWWKQKAEKIIADGEQHYLVPVELEPSNYTVASVQATGASSGGASSQSSMEAKLKAAALEVARLKSQLGQQKSKGDGAPKPGVGAAAGGSGKYCTHHKSYTHNTEECKYAKATPVEKRTPYVHEALWQSGQRKRT
jgi:hypothetical protein